MAKHATLPQRLLLYLNSSCIPPSDFLSYELNKGVHSDRCVFCLTKHNKYDWIELWGEHMGEPTAINAGICPHCADTIDGWDPRDFREVRIRQTAYLRTGKLPDDAVSYSVYCGQYEYKCIFCRESLHSKSNKYEFLATSIPIPIDPYLSTVGNSVNVCKDCSEDLTKMEHDYLSMGIKLANDLYEDKCVECNNSYPITKTERNNRAQKGTMGMFTCLDCAHEMNNCGSERVRNDTCGTCGKPFKADILHIDYCTVEGRALHTCSSCLHQATTFHYDVDPLRVFVTKVNGTWHYRIETVEMKTIMQQSTLPGWSKSEVAMYIGVRSAFDLIKTYGTQLKLF